MLENKINLCPVGVSYILNLNLLVVKYLNVCIGVGDNYLTSDLIASVIPNKFCSLYIISFSLFTISSADIVSD